MCRASRSSATGRPSRRRRLSAARHFPEQARCRGLSGSPHAGQDGTGVALHAHVRFLARLLGWGWRCARLSPARPSSRQRRPSRTGWPPRAPSPPRSTPIGAALVFEPTVDERQLGRFGLDQHGGKRDPKTAGGLRHGTSQKNIPTANRDDSDHPQHLHGFRSSSSHTWARRTTRPQVFVSRRPSGT
jgi:hypothetical protein